MYFNLFSVCWELTVILLAHLGKLSIFHVAYCFLSVCMNLFFLVAKENKFLKEENIFIKQKMENLTDTF